MKNILNSINTCVNVCKLHLTLSDFPFIGLFDCLILSEHYF